MHYIPLGDTALRVSRLCLGCMTFGEPDRGRHASDASGREQPSAYPARH